MNIKNQKINKLNSFLYKTISNFILFKMYNSINNFFFTNIIINSDRILELSFIRTDMLLENNDEILNNINFLSSNINLNKCVELKRYFGYIPKVLFKYDFNHHKFFKFNEKFFINKNLII